MGLERYRKSNNIWEPLGFSFERLNGVYGKLILLILTWLEVKKIQSIKVSTKSSTDNLERKKIHSNEKLLHLHWIEFNSYFTLFDDTNMQPYDIWWQRINVQREIDRFVIWVSQMVELLNIDRFNAWCYQYFFNNNFSFIADNMLLFCPQLSVHIFPSTSRSK